MSRFPHADAASQGAGLGRPRGSSEAAALPQFQAADSLASTKEDIMTAEFTSASSLATDEPVASRRDFVAVAVTAAAAVGATGSAQAQEPPNVRFLNPPGMATPTAYSHVVEVNGPHRIVYIAGQTGVDANGKL